jgi:RNA polymerase sigma-70 factor (ECF subfamily)
MPDDLQAAWIKGVLDRYERPLVAYARRWVGELETARDIVQDCFLRLCRQDRAKVAEHVGSWLYAVCRNRALDHLRKEGRMRTAEPEIFATLPDREDSPAEAVARDETVDRLHALVEEFPAREQEVLRLKFTEGLSYQAIAEVLDLTVTNVGWILHSCVRKLQDHFAVRAEGGAS